MSYVKMISSGLIIEKYEYDGHITGQRKRFSPNFRAGHVDSKVLDDVRSDSGQQDRKRRDNAFRASVAFKRTILANLSPTDCPTLLTLTHAENEENIEKSQRLFKLFIQRMRYTYGKGFKYLAVLEFQKRGAIHYHALVWGLPFAVLQEERTTRVVSKLWGQGYIFLKQTDGHHRLSTYLSKYMVKAILNPRLFNKKAFWGSRNLKRPVVSRGVEAEILENELDLSSYSKIEERKYLTKFLGDALYSKYDLSI